MALKIGNRIDLVDSDGCGWEYIVVDATTKYYILERIFDPSDDYHGEAIFYYNNAGVQEVQYLAIERSKIDDEENKRIHDFSKDNDFKENDSYLEEF